MTNDKRDLLDVLKTELEFLTKGGYRHMASTVHVSGLTDLFKF
jgi:hypothetical protein